MQPPDAVTIRRGAKPRSAVYALASFTEYFQGFDQIDTVRGLFGDQTKPVLDNLRIRFTGKGYMRVDSSGQLWISAPYLNTGRLIDLYLDIIHELVHVKQWLDGRDLRDRRYPYLERPTEIEAYRYTVAEARRLGLTDQDILEYLRTEHLSGKQLHQLARAVNIAFSED